MIQRIQTIYLLIATGVLIAAMCLPLGFFADAAGEQAFLARGVQLQGTWHSTWGLLSILMLNALVAFATIFLYKNRVLQIRFTTFNTLLLIGFYLAWGAFCWVLQTDGVHFRIGWALCLPLVAIILNLLAIRAIGRDEVMVKAADRLR